MFRKKAAAVTLSCILAGQLLLAPLAWADKVDDVVNNLLENNTTYKDLVTNQLKLDKNVADSFVRDVVKNLNLDTSKLTDQSYINQVKNQIMAEATKNPDIANAMADLLKDQGYEAAKNTAKNLANTIINELKTVPAPGGPGGGGGGGVISKEEFKINHSGSAAEVKSGGKQYINISGLQLKDLQKGSKPLIMNFGDVTITFSKEALNLGELVGQEEAMLRVEVKKLTPVDTKPMVAEGDSYKVAGNVFEFTAQQIDSSDKTSVITSFKGSVTVSLPVPDSSKESAGLGNLKVYAYNAKANSWELLGGTFNASKGEISFTVNSFSKYALFEKVVAAPATVTPRFKDVIGHWAAADIEYMAEKGYVKGIGEGNFGPQQSVTRAEFAAMLVNVLGIQEQGPIPFKDVPAEAWYYSSVAKLYHAGLAKGKSADSFDPLATITRQEMAAMLSNALQYQGKQVNGNVSTLAMFQDHQLIADWAKQAVANVFAVKIINGKPHAEGVIFAPNDQATRAEAVVMLRNFLKIN